jgi:C1A family cysteine protease
MVHIYADSGFMAYSSGIYSGCPSYSSYYVNHAVLLVGYDSNDNWIIKNQWGEGWGENGYATISNTNDCAIPYLGYFYASVNQETTD